MSNVRKYLQYNLTDVIENSGLTKKEIAEKLGVSAASVTKWVKGDNSPDIEIIAKICDLFNVSINSLLKMPKNDTDFSISDREKELIKAYRQQPKSVQEAVDRMLCVESEPAKEEKLA